MAVVPNALDLPPGSQPWKRSVDNSIAELQSGNQRSFQDMNNSLMALSNTVKVLGDQITALPVVRVYGDTSNNFALTGTWDDYAAFSFLVPAGKVKVQAFVTVNAAALDTISGGAAVAYGRINFGGVLSNQFPASKDAGASVVNNVISGTHYYNSNVLPGGRYTMKFEMYGTNPSAYPIQSQNFAVISANISFTSS